MTAPTIMDVAREAGLSVATVSRVINNKGTVKPETIQKVQETIERLGYQPNILGRNLRCGDSRVIVLMVPNVSNPFYAPIIQGAENTLREAGYSIMICTTSMDRVQRRLYTSMMQNRRADAAIVMDVSVDDKDIEEFAEHYPLIQCCEYCKSETISHVSVDNFNAARDAVHRLAELGHTRIGYIGVENYFISTELRYKGYLQGLEETNIRRNKKYVGLGSRDYGFAKGVEIAGHLLDQPNRPTAMFCISDVLALGACRAARERGLRIPEDLSVVGFDDVEYASMYYPRLSTIRQPCYGIGVEAARLLLRRLDGDTEAHAVFLPHEWVPRDSTAPKP